MNKIEEYKREKDGLEILHDVPRYAAEGWETITDGDKERLKWAGVFFRRQTPGHFMMRLRIPNGIVTATQLRTLGEISEQFGKGFADITTRQQMQLAVDAVAPHLRQAEKRRRAESYIDLVKLGAAMKKLPPRSRKIPCATARA
jgi:dissimilatory sulfite reductase (desulfoviridin) alpha/beta subunit